MRRLAMGIYANRTALGDMYRCLDHVSNVPKAGFWLKAGVSFMSVKTWSPSSAWSPRLAGYPVDWSGGNSNIGMEWVTS